MIRPELKEQMWRWREVIAGGAALVIGVWWLIRNSAFLLLPAIVLIIAGAALIWVGAQRTRFRGEGQGPGTVQVDEGQIAYFGPLSGGMVAIEDLTRVAVDGTQHPAHWQLSQRDGETLLIPVNADGADRLFDAFARLPGLRMDRALTALETAQDRTIVIWQRDVPVSAHRSLH